MLYISAQGNSIIQPAGISLTPADLRNKIDPSDTDLHDLPPLNATVDISWFHTQSVVLRKLYATNHNTRGK